MPCEVCGVKNAEIHHLDYSKPLKIKWLCRKHHCEWHKKNGIPPGIVDVCNFKTVYIDANLHRRLKSKSISLGISIQNLLEKIITKHIKSNE